MTQDGPVIANLRLDGILAGDVVVAELRQLVGQLEDAVVAEPMVSQSRYFSRAVARFSVANPSAQPLAVTARFLASRDIVPDDVIQRVSVAPGGVATLSVPVSARATRGSESLAPARARYAGDAGAAGEALTSTQLAVPRALRRGADGARGVGGRRPRRWGRLFVVDEPGGVATAPPRGGRRPQLGRAARPDFSTGVTHSIVASPDECARAGPRLLN
jgi:hypothetical protein